ncbi:hypothetical protein C8R43DRAFT_1124269 [Mycena crocata]|nr:hypothetical protein C8R43DRAFT_1124269 [Mycena crocata]
MCSFEDLTAKSSTAAAPKRKARSRAKGGKRGKKSWVVGTKLTFFELFIIKYGWFWNLTMDLEEDLEDPDDEAAEQLDEDGEGLSEEEQESRWTYYTDLHTKVGQWYHYHYRKVTGNDNWGMLLANGEGLPVKPPRKRRVADVYYDHYYVSRVKVSFEEEWAKISARPVPEGQKKPSRVNEMNKWTGIKFAEESDVFCAMVEEMTQQENAYAHPYLPVVLALYLLTSALPSFRSSRNFGSLPHVGLVYNKESQKTLEDYDEALMHAAVALQPFADTAAQRYGMVVSILLAGPIGANGGAIEVRSVHSGTTRGLAQKTWPQADHEGFRVVVNTMLRFGILAFCGLRRAHVAGNRGGAAGHPLSLLDCSITSAASGSAGMTAASTSSTAPPAPTSTTTSTTTPASTATPALTTTTASTTTAVSTKKAVSWKTKAKKKAAGGKDVVLGPAPPRPKPRPLPPCGAAAGTSASGGNTDGGDGSAASGDDGNGNGTDASGKGEGAGATAGGSGEGAGAGEGAGGANTGESAAGGSGDGEGTGVVSAAGAGAGASDIAGSAVGGEGGGESEEQGWAARTQTRWPAELQKLYAAMEQCSQWGKQWEDLADALVAFEEACGFPFDCVGMAKAGRVKMVERWMQIGRPYSYGPTPTSTETVSTLQEEFWAWWTGLQPLVRVHRDGGLDHPVGLDWGRLKDHAGRNGLGLVCVTLMWWGTLVHRTKGGDVPDAAAIADWEGTVEDVVWTLESLVKMGGLSKKHTGERGVTDKEPKKHCI